MLEKSLWFSWILKRQALRFCKAIFAFSRPASKNVRGFFSSVCVSLRILFTFIKHGPAHYSAFIIASGPHWWIWSVWKQNKTNLTRARGPVFERVWKHGECGYKNELWSPARAVAVLSFVYHLLITGLHFLCICNPRGIGLLLLCSLNALGEFHETLKIIEKEVRVENDIIWDHPCKMC